MSRIPTDSMTIDTSKEAVERLSRMCGAEASYKTHIGTLMAQASDMLVNLAAERDAQTARADAAEAREQALLSSYDAERKAMVENAAMRHDIARLTKSLSDEVTARVAAEAEVARLTDEIAKQMLADEMLRGLYDDEAADVVRLNAELRAMRAGQDALVAAAKSETAAILLRLANDMDDGWSYNAGNHVRALTPADATAAMEAKLRAERNKALRDAAKLYENGGGPGLGGWDYFGDYYDAILAMIEPENHNE